MAPTILRFEADTPDSAELRYYLRHAGTLLAASDVESDARAVVLRRARAWINAALCGVDQALHQIDPPAVPEAIADADTDAHDLSNLEIPTLTRLPRERQ